MVELVDAQKEIEEKQLAPVREKFWLYTLIGLVVSSAVLIPVYIFLPNEMSRAGGSLVGIAVFIDVVAHWFQLNPTKHKLKMFAVVLVPISGVTALIGTVFWTFGDKL